MDFELISGFAILAVAAGWTIQTLTFAFIYSRERRHG